MIAWSAFWSTLEGHVPLLLSPTSKHQTFDVFASLPFNYNVILKFPIVVNKRLDSWRT